MSGFLYEDLPQTEEGRMWWFAVVASNPVAFDEELFVTIPEFDPDLLVGPCFWQSRGSNLEWEFTTDYGDISGGEMRVHDVLPGRGDRCLVVFDNRKQPWVVAWWPYAT